MKILFGAHDPGGFNLLSKVILHYSKSENLEIHLALVGDASKRVKDMLTGKFVTHSFNTFPCIGFSEDVDVDEKDVEILINAVEPDIIFTATSINCNLERYLINEGNLRGIPTLAYIDSWAGEKIRFENTKITAYPQIALLIDERMLKIFEPIRRYGTQLRIVGNAHLENLKKRVIEKSPSSNKGVRRVLFFSENSHHYFPEKKISEFTVVNDLIRLFNENTPFILSIRPHPLEHAGVWENFINEQNQESKLRLELDKTENVFDSIMNSNTVIGISSMALIESAILGLPTFSYQINIPAESDMLCIPFDENGIIPITNSEDLTKIFSINETLTKIQSIGFKEEALSRIDSVICEVK